MHTHSTQLHIIERKDPFILGGIILDCYCISCGNCVQSTKVTPIPHGPNVPKGNGLITNAFDPTIGAGSGRGSLVGNGGSAIDSWTTSTSSALKGLSADWVTYDEHVKSAKEPTEKTKILEDIKRIQK